MHTCKGCGRHVDSLGELGPLPHGDFSYAYCDACQQDARNRHADPALPDREDERPLFHWPRTVRPSLGLAPQASERFREGLHSPFAVGLSLWSDAAPSVAAATAPVALAAAVCTTLGATAETRGSDGGVALVAVATSALFAFGILLSSTVVTHEYTGRIEGGVYASALRRLPAWALTWCLVGVGVLLGYFALIVPGVILGLRLFWADEFALAHDASPVQALKESWAITHGHARDLFVFQFLAAAVGAATLVALLGIWQVVVGILQAVPGLGALRLFLFLEFLFIGYSLIHATEVVKFYGMMNAYVERARAATEPAAVAEAVGA